MKFLSLYIVILLLITPSLEALNIEKSPEHRELIRGLVGEYHPDLVTILVEKTDRKSLIKKLKKTFIQEDKKIEYDFPTGAVRIWFDENDNISSVRFIFKTSHKIITTVEKNLLKKYKDKIHFNKNSEKHHANTVQIIDKSEYTGLEVTIPSSDDGTPRISEVFLSEGYFKNE